VAGQGRYHQHADAICPASWTAIHSFLTGGVVAPRWDLPGYAGLHGHAVRLMKRRGGHGLGGSCDGQSKSNSDQPDHCHLHMNLPNVAEGDPLPPVEPEPPHWTHISTAGITLGLHPAWVRLRHKGSAKGSAESKISSNPLCSNGLERWGQSSANSSLFRCFAGKYREIRRIQTGDDD
jgi:hypothetical protein